MEYSNNIIRFPGHLIFLKELSGFIFMLQFNTSGARLHFLVMLSKMSNILPGMITSRTITSEV